MVEGIYRREFEVGGARVGAASELTAIKQMSSRILDHRVVLLPTLPGNYSINPGGHASGSVLPPVTSWPLLLNDISAFRTDMRFVWWSPS